jgi:VWFA-related protein
MYVALEMRRTLALLIVLAALGCLAVPSAGAQTAPQVQVSSVSTDAWPTAEASVTVLDSSGLPVTGLGPESFSVSLGGTSLPVTNVTPASAPGVGIAVVLTFDTSGSMAGAPMEQSKAAGKELVAQLGPDDQAAVVSFADAVTLAQGFTGDRGALNAAIDSLQATGNTALYAGVRDSIQLASTAPLPRRSVVLLSDGVDFGGVSGVDPNTTLQMAATSGAVIITIGLGTEIDANYLSSLAAAGHGQFLQAPTPADLAGAYSQAANILRNQYIVTIDASGVDPAAAAGQPLEVQVVAGGATGSASAPITVPQGFTPAPTQAATPPPAGGAATSEDSGGLSPMIVAGVALAVAIPVALAGVFLFRRLRRSRRDAAEVATLRRFQRPDAPPALPEIERAVAEEEARAWLRLPDGSTVPLGMSPVTIGFTADCKVQLPDAPVGAMERARVWWRDGSFMLHNLSRAGIISIGGKPVTWAVLEEGDEIEMGGSTVVFTETEPKVEV